MSKLWAGGTTLAMESTDIAQVISITPPPLALDTEEVTDNDSEGVWEEVVGTVLRSGEVGLNVHMDPTETSHTDLMSAMVDRAIKSFTLTFPDEGEDPETDPATTWEFSALVTGFEIDEASYDGKLTASITLKVTGKPTITGVNDA